MQLVVSDKTEKLYIPLTLVVLALGVFHTTFLNVVWEMAGYMTAALDLYNGKSFPVGPPAFPVLIALSYFIGGVSVESAFWVVRIFAVMGPVAVYFFGRKFFDWRIGLAAAGLYFTSYAVNFAAYRHVDGIWPLFILAALYFFQDGLATRAWKKLALAGALIGFAAMFSSLAAAFVFFPFAFCLIHSRYRRQQSFIDAGVTVAIAAVMAAPFVSLPELSFSLEGMIESFKAFFHGREMSVGDNFVLAPLMLLAWLWALDIYVRRGRRDVSLFLAAGLVYLPMMFYLASHNGEVGAGLVFYQLSFVLLAMVMTESVETLARRLPKYRRWHGHVLAVLVLSLMMVQMQVKDLNERVATDFFKRASLYKVVMGQTGMILDENYFLPTGYQPLVTYLQENLTAKDGIAVEGYGVAKAVYFYLQGQIPVANLPVLACTKHDVPSAPPPASKEETPFYIDSAARYFDRDNFSVFLVYQSTLFDELKKAGTTHIITSGVLAGLESFFSQHPAFELVDYPGQVRTNRGRALYTLYKVHPEKLQETSFKPLLTVHFLKEMAWAVDIMPDRYQEILADIATCTGGHLTPEKLERMLVSR